LLAGAVCGSAEARPPSLEGKWRLNAKESELLPGETPPQELVMAITVDDGTKFRWTVSVKMPDGASGETSFEGAIDGKSYPVKGRPGSTSSFSWTQDGALKQVSESPGGIAIETCTFTGGESHITGRRMTCASRQTDSRGRAASYVEVFDRQ
jgi:hypothetical protein